ncbi:MAG: PAAR domain-containing protein [Ectothiorhodospiraceae bacterium]|nr:PAAR domain-containing protein [Ectothiorhodospiraceae bacterium]MCH8505000.1 PAAR domain-containing protein [Ectothiorhodospiraceae bacterium]
MGSKSRQPAARLTDIGDQHNGYPPTPIMQGSPDVQCNGRPVARQGDMLVPHTKPKKPPHPRNIKEGSGSVLVNGVPWARVSDAISCGGTIITGSGDVLVGDSPKNRNPISPEEWDALTAARLDRSIDTGNRISRQQVAADIAVKFRGAEGAIASWHDYYYRMVGREEPFPSPAEITDPLARQGLERARQEAAEEAAESDPPQVEQPPPNDSTPHSGLHNRKWSKADANEFTPLPEKDIHDDPKATDSAIELLKEQGWNGEKIAQVLESGHSFQAQVLEPGEKLYGFMTEGVPKDIQTSAYWTDEATFKDLAARHFRGGSWDREQIKEELALPCYNRANTIDIAEVTERQVAVKSTINPASELLQYTDKNGKQTELMPKAMAGGGTQITPDPRKLRSVFNQS